MFTVASSSLSSTCNKRLQTPPSVLWTRTRLRHRLLLIYPSVLLHHTDMASTYENRRSEPSTSPRTTTGISRATVSSTTRGTAGLGSPAAPIPTSARATIRRWSAPPHKATRDRRGVPTRAKAWTRRRINGSSRRWRSSSTSRITTRCRPSAWHGTRIRRNRRPNSQPFRSFFLGIGGLPLLVHLNGFRNGEAAAWPSGLRRSTPIVDLGR
jgi:hypothetical protein